MPVRYSTNWMGPISMDWYRKRDLTRKVTITVKGQPVETEDIVEHWCSGRIDIRGEDGAGKFIDNEYALAPMISEDWHELSDWLDTVETDFMWRKEDLLHHFERFVGRKITWDPKSN